MEFLSSFRSKIRYRSLALLAAAAFVAGLVSARAAQAQLKAKDLIGYAVEEVEPKHEDVDRAIQKFAQRDVQGSLQLLQQASRIDPMLPPPQITLAKLYLLSKQPVAARATLEKVRQMHPQDPEPILIFGEQAVVGGRITDSKLLFDAARGLIEAYSGNPKRKKNFQMRLHAGLATVAERLEDWSQSIEHLNAWLEVDPENVRAHQRLGRALFMSGSDREAYVSFMEAAKYDDDMPHPDVIIARLYEQKGDHASAKKFMDRALQNRNNNRQTRLAAVRWLVETDQISKAKPEVDAIISDHPDSVDAHLFAGIIARIMKDDQQAMEHLEKAYLLAPSNFDATNQLALFLITKPAEEMRQRAVKYAETNLRLHNKNSEAAVALGWIYYQVGRTREAEELLNKALRGGKLSADSSYFIARIFWDRGKNAEAEKLLEAALDSKRVFVNRNEAKVLLAKIKQ